jgi:ABC-2 type transport system ATP-binding protein
MICARLVRRSRSLAPDRTPPSSPLRGRESFACRLVRSASRLALGICRVLLAQYVPAPSIALTSSPFTGSLPQNYRTSIPSLQPRGSLFGVLGPNGAGKTTTIRILATLLRPDAGSARVLGHDVVAEATAVRARIALTAQFASLDVDLTGFENLVVLGRLLGHSWRGARARAGELLEAFELADVGGRPVAQLSGGMRRRLDIAASIIVTPELLFLDEPTTGLDPRSRRQVWGIVRAIVARGTTVLLTTQDLAEADELSDRIAVIDHGRVIAEGHSSELKARVGGDTMRVRVHDPGQRPRAERILGDALGAGPPRGRPDRIVGAYSRRRQPGWSRRRPRSGGTGQRPSRCQRLLVRSAEPR